MNTVYANLQTVHERIASAIEESGRVSDDVTLIAVTKTVPVDRIRKAVDVGVRHFGENRVQEALSKFASSGGRAAKPEAYKVAREGLTLHMIGSLQRNKVRAAVALFDVVHSVDRVELAETLEDEAARVALEQMRAEKQVLPVLIEVNTTGEASKSGVAPGDLSRLAEKVGGCEHLRGVGLMTVARLGASEAEARRTFADLRRMLESLRGSSPGDWHHLSMGMSDDYEYAIREGATMIRLGRAIFGERDV